LKSREKIKEEQETHKKKKKKDNPRKRKITCPCLKKKIERLLHGGTND
jgi:hypothetical protein